MSNELTELLGQLRDSGQAYCDTGFRIGGPLRNKIFDAQGNPTGFIIQVGTCRGIFNPEGKRLGALGGPFSNKFFSEEGRDLGYRLTGSYQSIIVYCAP